MLTRGAAIVLVGTLVGGAGAGLMVGSAAAATPFASTALSATGPSATPVAPSSSESPSPSGLSVNPVGQKGSYFVLTLKPGSTTTYSVLLSNTGTAQSYRTYVADVFTVIGGGLGAKNHTAARSRTSTWLSYPTAVAWMSTGESVVKKFTVTVPARTVPGQYISSVVIENAAPSLIGAGGALSQIVRTVIAVSIRVPGALSPTFAIQGASLLTVSGVSVLSVHLQNTGTAQLSPHGNLRVVNNHGTVVWDKAVSMGSFYAGTKTQLEVSLHTALPKGLYTSTLTLADARTGATAAGAIPVLGVGEKVPAVAPMSITTTPAGSVLWVVVGMLLIVGIGAPVAVICRRRTVLARRRSGFTGPASLFSFLIHKFGVHYDR